MYVAVSLYLIYMADFSKLFLMQFGVLSAMSILSSCIYDSQPECRDEKVEFSIVNDWENSPGANPEGMAYLFFAMVSPISGGSIFRERKPGLSLFPPENMLS